MQLPIKTSYLLIIVGVLVVVAAITMGFSSIFQGTPPKIPEQPSVLREPKTIGLIFFRQQAEVVAGFKEGMKELGYSNITYKEFPMLIGDKTPQESAEYTKTLIKEKADLILTALEFQALPAIEATKEMGNSTPIVFMAQFHDPVSFGLAKSFRSSGNNATGVSLNFIDLIQKHMEFIRKINPNIKKLGMFTDGFMVPALSTELYPEFRRQAAKFGYEVVTYTTKVPPPEAEKAWYDTAAKIKSGDIDAIYHLAGHYFTLQEEAETKLAARLKIPLIVPLEDLVTGGHFGYSGDYTSAGKQSARMADKILRGAKPSDIPLEYMEKISLHVNLSRLQQAGVEFPESILKLADKIVK